MPNKAVLFFLFGLILAAAPAAAAPIAFQVDNMSIEMRMNGGQSQTGVITVTNVAPAPASGAAGDPIWIKVYPVDWTLDRTGKPLFAPAGSAADSCSGWLSISPLELEIAPGQSKPVRFTVTVPAGAQGTFRSMIMFESAPQPAAAGAKVLDVNGRIGSALYVTVGPQAKRMRIDAFGVTPGQTLLTVQNTGNTFIRLKGTLQFTDASGRTAAQVALPGAVVLSGPNDERDFDLTTPKLPSGAYTATVVIDYGGAVLIGARTHVTVP